MSYARPGDAGGSDVYVFASTSSIECCGCIRADDTFRTTDPAAMLAHLDEHEQAGDHVPSRTRPEIEQDWADGEFADWDTSDPKGPRPDRDGPRDPEAAADELTALTEDMGLYDEHPIDRDGPRCTHCRRTAADHLAFGKCPIEVDGWRHTFTEEGS